MPGRTLDVADMCDGRRYRPPKPWYDRPMTRLSSAASLSSTRRQLAAVVQRLRTPSVLLLSFSLVGCGASHSTTSSVTTTPTTVAHTSSTHGPTVRLTTSTTTFLQASSSPEMVFCDIQGTYAVPLRSSSTVGLPLIPSLKCAPTAEVSLNDYSPDLSMTTDSSTESDGSQVVGYQKVDGTELGPFVDLSGHETGYSGSTVDDGDELFNPITGDLWWTRAAGPIYGDMYFSPGAGHLPVDRGKGITGSFMPNGEPSPVGPADTSPSGGMLAIRIIDSYDDEDIVLGTPHDLTGSCLEKAWNQAATASNVEDSQEDRGDAMLGLIPTTCAGVTVLGLPSPGAVAEGIASVVDSCATFLGLISDSRMVCETSDANGSYFDAVPFTLSGGKFFAHDPIRLTPSTEQTVAIAGMSPDGRTLLYSAEQQQSSVSTLYEVPTSAYSATPASYSPSIPVQGGQESSLADFEGLGVVLGWVSHGKLVPTYLVPGEAEVIYPGGTFR